MATKKKAVTRKGATKKPTAAKKAAKKKVPAKKAAKKKVPAKKAATKKVAVKNAGTVLTPPKNVTPANFHVMTVVPGGTNRLDFCGTDRRKELGTHRRSHWLVWRLGGAGMSFLPIDNSANSGFEWGPNNPPLTPFDTPTLVDSRRIDLHDTHHTNLSDGCYEYTLRATDGNAIYTTTITASGRTNTPVIINK